MTLVHVIRLHEGYISSVRRQRPYHVESTGSRPITKVKQRRARLGTPGAVGILSFFFFFFVGGGGGGGDGGGGGGFSDFSPSVQTA